MEGYLFNADEQTHTLGENINRPCTFIPNRAIVDGQNEWLSTLDIVYQAMCRCILFHFTTNACVSHMLEITLARHKIYTHVCTVILTYRWIAPSSI